MNMYYVGKNGKNLGPFDEATVLDLLRSGSFSPNDAGCPEGMNEWKPLSALFPNLVVIPPPLVIVQSPRKSGSGPGLAMVGIGVALMFFSGIAIVWSRNYIQRNLFTSGLGGMVGYRDSNFEMAQALQSIAPLVLIVGLVLLIAGGVLAIARKV